MSIALHGLGRGSQNVIFTLPIHSWRPFSKHLTALQGAIAATSLAAKLGYAALVVSAAAVLEVIGVHLPEF